MKLLQSVTGKFAGGLALGLSLMLNANLTAQDLIPTASWSEASGPWTTNGNWTILGTDPAENSAPAESEIASIQNGGTSSLTSGATVHALAIGDGTLDLGAGGALTVSNETTLSNAGVISFNGGTLNTDVFGAVGGTIDLSSSVATDLSLGSTYPIITANRFGGNVDAVTLDGGTGGLANGLRLSLIPSDAGASVTVETAPKITVDRLTGAMAMVNGAGPLDLKGYIISSPNGFLNRRTSKFNSFEDRETPGWAEANFSVNQLAEYNLEGSTTLAAGQTLEYGLTAEEGIGVKPAKESITFEYLTGDGRILPGLVEYIGPVADIILNIDPETGAGSIEHNSPVIGDFDIAGFTLASESGSLNDSGFTGLGDGWDTSPNNSSKVITEFSLSDSILFSNGVSADLGNLFDVNGTQDVSFRYSLSNGIQASGSVVYGLPDVVVSCTPANSLLGDLDGSGDVSFADFLTLSANFGQTVSTYAEGDIDCSGDVSFADFLALSANFGQSLAASPTSSVPEPSGALLLFVGLLGMMKFRKRTPHIAAAMVVATVMTTGVQDAQAQFSGRAVRIHPQAANAGIDSLSEFYQILAGERTDIIVNEDFTFEAELADFGGGEGAFPDFTENYPEGPNGEVDEDMNTFGIILSAEVTIPAGDYSIACGSDDGCWVRIDGVTFAEKFNENGPATADNEIAFSAGRGHAFTTGNFTLDDDLTTTMEAGFYENGGGDSFEIAVSDGFFEDGDTWGVDGIGEELADDALGWSISPGAYTGAARADLADFNGDGVLDLTDAALIERNLGDAGADGDANGDGIVDLADVWDFSQKLAAQAGGPPPASESVPEPSGSLMLLFAVIGLFGARRRRN